MRSTRHLRRTGLRLLAAVAVAAVLALIAAACGDSDDDAASTTAETSEPSSDTADDEEALASAVDELVAVCEDQDHARLRDLIGPGAQDRIRDQDNVFNEDVENITVLDREVSIDGDSATVTVTLEITLDGETSEAERVWEFEKVDDVWVLSAVPDCTFP